MHHAMYFRIILLSGLMVFLTAFSTAQIRPGIKFGVSTPDVAPRDFIVKNPAGENIYHVFVEKARYGVHAGVFIQIKLGNFFIQPEGLYNSSTVDYKLDSLGEVFKFRDTYRNLDFPVMLGLKAGPVRIGGGPVAHIHFQDQSGFKKYDDFDQFYEDLTWGWQAGIGLDLWKLHFDLRYEGNFSQFGDHITFFGDKYDFDTSDNRFIASLGFSF